MLYKGLELLTYIAIAFMGLAMLPYLLVRVWGNRIPLKKKARGVDFDCRGWEI